METIENLLEPIASQFRSLGMPEPIVHWGHPLMMSIVILAMGTAAGIAGWRGRTATDPDVKQKNLGSHRQIAPLMFLFLALGYTGGILSLVMQRESIFQSPHFWTGSIVLILLTAQALLSVSGFWGDRSSLRTVHAYVGSATLVLAIVHMVLGFKLGLSI
ncbi:MAG TPA: DUF4079 domain-containing protein [Oscillatoriales cyanobacterium M59_W2019_021]|nr:DUF4079 domain-containing protein [Oscillatoriales cyanobacterium M4454_W2019_049]HIK50440.1 DUF4079 domain-containing protein [Oscillatoriales cyanobacterium M59_W2019_021]